MPEGHAQFCERHIAACIVMTTFRGYSCILDIAWKGPGHPLYMTGPAVHVYDGFIHL